ncbi:MAG: hypothetical protein JWO08_4027, partial [Verrucomicrobiaceae bacterium]|nr:hypothetical protein [Verrucomicrobiaceae bacterium]
MKSVPLIAALLLGSLCLSPVRAADFASPNQEARFLAGLPVDGPLEPLTHEYAWKEHSKEFGKAWAEVEKKQLSKISEWMPQVANHAYEDTSPLYYLFSGPDFLYAHAFFPNASTTIMCGIEPVGPPPDIASLTPESRAAALRTLRKSLEAVLSFSFFKTKDMKVDFQSTELTGTLPVLYLFIAHAGCHIDSVQNVYLNANGEEGTERDKVPGAKITYHGPSNKPQTLYYFSSDLSDDGIKNNPAFLTFCDKHGMGNSFAKAASYLMHLSSFSAVRDFLLSHTKTLIQDDSGIPYKYLHRDAWDVRLAGHYKGPIDLFKENYQTDLMQA